MNINYAAEYQEGARKVAAMLSQLENMKERWQLLMEHSGDNGDPYIDAEEALLKLGHLLSSLVIYQHEYERASEAETPDEPQKGKEKGI